MRIGVCQAVFAQFDGLVAVIKGPRSWTKDAAIRTAIEESRAEYHPRLGRILHAPHAAEFAPMLVPSRTPARARTRALD